MSAATLRERVARLGLSSRALAALGVAARARVTETPLEPVLRARIDAVLDALGVRRLFARLDPVELKSLLGGIRTELSLGARLVSGDAPAAAWSATDRSVLQAAGDASTAVPGVLARAIAPRLDGLPERLGAPGAAFLDVGVGVGVAAMTIEMARRWPSLRVVGIDPWPAAIAAARDNVERAGLADRIELREQRAEDLSDEGCFDLAWVPGLFISGRALPAVLARVHRALRPGGWLLLAFADSGADPDPLATALARLRTTLWGGTEATCPEAEDLLRGPDWPRRGSCRAGRARPSPWRRDAVRRPSPRPPVGRDAAGTGRSAAGHARPASGRRPHLCPIGRKRTGA